METYDSNWGVKTPPQQVYATPCNGWPNHLSPYIVNQKEKQELQDLKQGRIPVITSQRKQRLENTIAQTDPLEAKVLKFIQHLLNSNRRQLAIPLQVALKMYKQESANEDLLREQLKRAKREVIKEQARGKYNNNRQNKTIMWCNRETARLQTINGRYP